jgi:putative heme iron utilization protein
MSPSQWDRGEPVRTLMRAERHGVLSTFSKKIAGWPFGSLVGYAQSASGEPILLISEIAEHTNNLRVNPRASLFIQDSLASEDPQAGIRVTLMGFAKPIGHREIADARERYLARFPKAEKFFLVHDFTLFKLRTEHIRYIGGFGDVHWLTPGDAFPDRGEEDPLSPYADEICIEVNSDRSRMLIPCCARYAGLKVHSAQITSIDSLGFDLLAEFEGGLNPIRINFPARASTVEEARKMLAAMLEGAAGGDH